MYGITKEMTFEAAHRLLDYNGPCGNLHGHSYKVQVTVCSDALDSQGFVMDFGDLKIAVNKIIGEWDHAVILQDRDPLVPTLQAQGQKVVVFHEQPTAEYMANAIYNGLRMQGLNVSQVVVYETANNCASVC
jgi:6-pyruvoyltetrahydropterin/6-carboxytetrahydropterin synthase